MTFMLPYQHSVVYRLSRSVYFRYREIRQGRDPIRPPPTQPSHAPSRPTRPGGHPDKAGTPIRRAPRYRVPHAAKTALASRTRRSPVMANAEFATLEPIPLRLHTWAGEDAR